VVDYLWLVRGNTILNSVKSPGSVSTSMLPPCCLTMMSWLIDRPSPVPSPEGLVVKNGLILAELWGTLRQPHSQSSTDYEIVRLLKRFLQRLLIVGLGIFSVWSIVFVVFETADRRLPWILAVGIHLWICCLYYSPARHSLGS
jgi:hypothetical protein